MKCEDCYWGDKCPMCGEICDDFCPIDDEKIQTPKWSLEEWYQYIAEYGDGNYEYEEDCFGRNY